MTVVETDVTGNVIFLTASQAQTADAEHVIQQLDSRFAIVVVVLDRRAQPDPLTSVVFLPRKREIKHKDLSLRKPRKIGQFWQILKVRRILRSQLRPGPTVTLVVGDDVCPVERSTIRFANKKGINTVLIQDGMLENAEEWLGWVESRRQKDHVIVRVLRYLCRFKEFMPPPRFYGTNGCATLAIWGEYTKELMLGCGVPERAVQVTGSPRSDEWFSMARNQCEQVQALKSPKKVLFASLLLANYDLAPYQHDCQVMSFLDGLACDPASYEIVVRPHPSEKIESYERLFSLLGVRCLKVEASVPLRAALRGCDLLLTYFSTIIIEAIILKKPVLCLKVKGMSAPAYLKEDAVTLVENIEDLGSCIAKHLCRSSMGTAVERAREKFLLKYLGYCDGRSASRVARLIEKAGACVSG